MMDQKQRRRTLILAILLIVAIAAILSIQHDIDVEVEGNGTVEPTHASVRLFATAEFRLVPDEGYRIGEVLVDGQPKDVDDGVLRLTNVTEDHKVHVRFIPSKLYGLDVTHNGFGTVTPGSGAYGAGERVVVNITPNDGYVVSDVMLDDRSVGSTNRLEIVMDSDHAVVVTFRPAEDTDPLVDVTVDVDVGVVTGAFYGDVSPSGLVRVAYGGTLNITITLNQGYVLSSVTVDGEEVGTSPVVTVTDITKAIKIDISVISATIKTYTITSSSSSGGSITPSGSVTVAEGRSMTFLVKPDSGYHLSSLTVDGASVSISGDTYTFTDVRGDHTITAVFAADPTPPSPRTLKYISVSDPPTTCMVNQTLDTSSMVVTAYWSDGTQTKVTGYSISPDKFDKTGEYTVTVAYMAKTDTFRVTVISTFTTEVITIDGRSGENKPISQSSPMQLSGMAPGDAKTIVVDLTAKATCDPYLMLYGLMGTTEMARYVELTVTTGSGTWSVNLNDLPTGEPDPEQCISFGQLEGGKTLRITIDVTLSSHTPVSMMNEPLSFTLGIGVC